MTEYNGLSLIVTNKLGFEEEWIKKLMMCVKSVSFSILINVEPKGLIEPSRDSQQGDHSSPYLFLIRIESLISLLSKAVKAKQITCIQISIGAPSINHLQFVDDSTDMLEN